jgi:transposase
METRTKRIIQKRWRDITQAERHSMVQEMLKNNWTKQYTWERYTGEPEEHGHILKWMRQAGYEELPPNRQIVRQPGVRTFVVNQDVMSKSPKSNQESFEMLQFKNRIEDLEKQLKDAQLKVVAYATMIELAEKELNINIKKKFNSKSSEK